MIITTKKIETPLGSMIACAVDKGICLLQFTDQKMLETELKNLAKKMNTTISQGNHPHFDILEIQLSEYFAGKRKVFSVPLVILGSDFQNSVWLQLQNTEYGKTTSYKDQAISINKPKAVRAVANANGKNKISILIPCHRIIGSDGKLTGYSGGISRKEWLLKLEENNMMSA